jgi:uncharacterized membrane protein YuzA (DUF378 family)
MKTLDVIAIILVVVGGLNWGLVGVLDFDLVAAICGQPNVIGADWWLPRLIYILVGLAAIYDVVALRGIQNRWCVRHPAPA